MKESKKEKRRKKKPSHPIRNVKCIVFPVSHENGFLFLFPPSFRVVHGSVFSGELQSSVI